MPKNTPTRPFLAGAIALLAIVVAATAWVLTRDGGAAAARVLDDDTRLGTVELLVADLDLQRTFYGDALGLEVLEESADAVALGAGEQELVRLVRTDDARPGPNEAGLYHSALLYPDEESLAAVLLRIAEVAPESFQGASDHTVSQAFYFGDREGNGVELYVDRPREGWEWDGERVTMGSVPLDPNAFIAQHLVEEPAGVPSVGHVHLKVGDLDDARDFYVDTLGFDVTSETNGALFMSAGGYHHHLAANTWSSDGAGPRTTTMGLGSFQVVLASDAELRAMTQRLDDAGADYELADGRLSVADPWGNAVVIRVGSEAL